MSGAKQPAFAARIVAGLFVSGFALRLQLAGVGPLIPAIQDELQLDHAVAGLFITVALFAIGLAALAAPWIARQMGPRGALTAALVSVAVLGGLRVMPEAFLLMLALSVPLGIAVGIGSAGLPLAIRAYMPTAPARTTSVYALGLYVGAMAAAATAIPISLALGGWRLSLLSLSLGTLVAAAAWYGLAPRDRQERPAEHDAPRSRESWLVPGLGFAVVVYAIRSAIFQGYSAWLPSMYIENDWNPREAGALLAVLVGAGAVAVLVAGPLADWRGSRRLHLTASALLLLVGAIGLIVLPSLAWLWAVVAGLAVGAQFTVALTLPLDLAPSRGSLAAISAIVVGVGSLVASVTPTALGALRDLVGNFSVSSWLLAGLSAFLVFSSALVDTRAQSSPSQEGKEVSLPT
jgi:CP family cyanate transporter-like MFS transporter